MSFGSDTDYWGFADTRNKLQSSSRNPTKSEAQCLDSNGDVAAATMYDSFTEQSCVYRRCHDSAIVLYDTTTSIDFRAGTVIGGYVITGIEVSTNNTERPEITISGRSTSTADGSINKYDPTDLEIVGSRKATKIGATVDSVSKLTGSSGSLAVNTAIVLDSLGVASCLDVYGGRVEATNDYVGCTGDPGAAVDTGWTVSSGGGDERENTAYGTGSISVFKNLTQM